MKQAILNADNICAHRFCLLGYDNLDFGREIDWHLDPVHKKRAPLKPWFKVPFLDFSVAGDHKVTWELNRHQHLVLLAKAWVFTHDEKYPAELVSQWYGWSLANPFPMGINWSSSLEVALRSLSWLWVRFLLAGCSAVSPAFEHDLLHALAVNGTYIEKYLSTYFSPNTHLLGEAVALLFIGTLCPQIPSAGRWRDRGWRIVLQEAERQVRRDGVYFEQSLYYHVYALDFLLHARLLAALNQSEVPRSFDTTLGKMLDVLHAVSQGGPPDGFGDDDGGRIFDPGRNRSEHLSDPLAIGAILLDRHDLGPSASLTEEALWLFGEQAVSFVHERPARPPLRAACFKEGGIYVMASSDRCAQRMVIDAGPMGAGRAGHGHADALSVTVSVGGRRWLVDSGTFCYTVNDQERDRFRGTRAHNTLLVDGLDQAVPVGPFAWNSQPNVRMEGWIVGATFSMFVGSHTGYLRLPDPVLHRRFVFHLHGAFWLVRDLAVGRERHRLETSWHFAPDLQVSDATDSFLACPAKYDAGSDERLALVAADNPAWMHTLGWDDISPAYGAKQPAQVLRFSAHVLLPAECAALIGPLLHPSRRPGTLTQLIGKINGEGGAARGYRYDDTRDEHYMMFSSGDDHWTLGPWSSDAKFIYCGTRDGKVVRFVVYAGSVAELNGKSILRHTRRIQYLEWLNQTSEIRIFSSDEDAILSFSQSALESRGAGF